MRKLVLSILVAFSTVSSINAQNKSYNLNDLSIGNLKSISISGKPSAPVFQNSIRSRELFINPVVQSVKSIEINDTILLYLFENKQYNAYIEKIDVDVNGAIAIRARIVNYDYGYCLISTFNGKSFITVEVPENNELYMSKFDYNTNKYFLLQIDKSKQKELEESSPIIPPNDNEPGDKLIRNTPQGLFNQKSLLNSSNENDSDTRDTITLMIVYTPAAAVWSNENETNINNTISLLMAKAQLALDNSNALISIKLVFSAQVNYTELNNNSDLYNLTLKGDGFLEEIHNWRDAYCADIVVLLENIEFTGGIAWQLNSTLGLPDYAFSLSRVQQVSWSYATIHEIAHNFGCSHHKLQNVEPGPGLFSFSAGYRWTGYSNVKYCSVMTYEDGKYFADGIGATRVPFFSSPDIQYQGVPIGDPIAADNARTLRQTKNVVASYRSKCSNCTPPSIQATDFKTTDIDDNSITVSWTRGNGNSVLVVARRINAPSDVPVNETAYKANAAFGYGTQTGAGNYVVYNGTGTSVDVAALKSGTSYSFDIYEYNSSSNCYLKPAFSGTAATTGTPPNSSSLPWAWQNPLPQGNNLTCVKFIDTNTGYAVGDAGTIIKTTNGGIDWVIQNSGTTQKLNSVYFIDAMNGYAVGYNVILKTIDGGTNWSIQKSGLSYAELFSVYFINKDSGYIVGGDGQILKTTNGGEDWLVQSSGTSIWLNSVYFSDTDTGYACGGTLINGTILKTINGGKNWTIQFSGNASVSMLWSVSFLDKNTGFATGWDNNYSGTILKTIDGGISWIVQPKSNLPQTKTIYWTNANTGFAGGYDPNTSSSTIYKTTNGGLNWSSQSTSPTYNVINSITFWGHDTGFAVGSDGLILKTTDGGINWIFQSTGMGMDLQSVYFTDTKTGYASGNNLFKTTNGGATWTKHPSIAGTFSVFFTDDNNGYAVGGQCPGVAKIYKTINGGTDWAVQYFSTVNYFFRSVFFIDSKTGYVVGDSGNIYKTTNGGINWEVQSSGTTNALKSVYFSDANTGYIVGDAGTILKTTDGGTNWIAQNTVADINLSSVQFIDASKGYAVGTGGLPFGGGPFGIVLKTTNGGKDWTTMLSLGDCIILNSICLIDSNLAYVIGRDCFSMASGILLKTINGGTDWTKVSIGVSKELHSIFFTDSNNGFAVGEGSAILKITDGGEVNPFPSEAGLIAGTATVCQGESAKIYSVAPISNATCYSWAYSGIGATINNSNTNNIYINFAANATSGNLSVHGNNDNGDGGVSKMAINVNKKPGTPEISRHDNILHSNAPLGNQWYNQNGLISNATYLDYTYNSSGDYYVIVTLLGCRSVESNVITCINTGMEENENNKSIKIYPNPVTDVLTIEIKGNTKILDFEILNSLGKIVCKGKCVEKVVVKMANFNPDVYLIKLENGKTIKFVKSFND